MNFISFTNRIKMLFFLTVNLMSTKLADALSSIFFAAKKKPAKKPAKKKSKKDDDSSDDNMGNDDQGSFNSGQF